MLLEFLSAIILKPLLLLLDELETIVKVIRDDGSRDAEHSKFLDNHEVQVEGLLVLNLLTLLFTLLLSGATDRSHCCSFSLLFRLRDLNLTIGQLLINSLLNGLLSLFSLQLSGDLLAVDDEASADLQGSQVTDEVVTAIEFLSIRVRQTFDRLIALILALLLHRLVRDDFVLLSLHPLDVHNLLPLQFEVVAALPVCLALLVLLRVERIELLVDGFD